MEVSSFFLQNELSTLLWLQLEKVDAGNKTPYTRYASGPSSTMNFIFQERDDRDAVRQLSHRNKCHPKTLSPKVIAHSAQVRLATNIHLAIHFAGQRMSCDYKSD